MTAPVVACHSLMVWSALADAMLLPSGQKTTACTGPACCRKASSSLSVAASHTRTEPSRLPEAIRFPVGSNTTARTLSVWPTSLPTCLPGSGVVHGHDPTRAARHQAKSVRTEGQRVDGFVLVGQLQPFPARGGVPESYRVARWLEPISAGRGQRPAICRQGNGGHPCVVPEGEHLGVAGYVPELDGPVPTGGGNPPAVGVDGREYGNGGVSRQGKEGPPVVRVPEPDGLVLPHRHEPVAVGGKGDRAGEAGVTVESHDVLARGHVPEADRLVPACRGQPPAVGAERNSIDDFFVPIKGGEVPAGGSIPQFDGRAITGGC